MPPREAARLVELLQASRPMRLFRNCRYLTGASVEEILSLTSQAAGDEAITAVADTVRAAKQVPLADGRRVPSVQIDDLIGRLRA